MPDLVNGNSQELPASQSPDSRNGQEPTASQVPSSARDGSGSSSSSSAPIGAEDKDAIIESLRRENAKYRKDDKRLAELEKLYQDAENAKLSEKERLEKQLSDYQTKLADAERSRQETAVRADIKLAAAELGMKLELARRILDYAAIEYDEEGDPKNVATLLAKAADEYGLSVNGAQSAASSSAQQQQQQQQRVTSGGAVNPGRSATSSNGLFDGDPQTVMQRIARLSPSEYAARGQEISAFIANNWQKISGR